MSFQAEEGWLGAGLAWREGVSVITPLMEGGLGCVVNG
ncbi:Unknown protein sequence [Pseudomonas syringae pv. cilantro]|uniref:Uncharacterized protein n=1 Tax=Pseudomonas syringae pv. cilantro TaxID=81035 RepID=A0A0N0XDK9_PSESX|nr:Unknown protein sequence [Pseudomonas syringae pv. cilantro]